MKTRWIILTAALSIGLFGCSNETETLSKEEQEEIYREEVRKKLDEEAAAETESEQVNETDDKPEEVDPVAEFEALPQGVQASVISTFYDERATADSLVNGGMSTAYAFDENYLIMMVTSGVGSGHPIYLLKRQEDTYIPVDGVVFVGPQMIENSEPPQVEVSLTELAKEYEANQALYDQTNDPSYTWDITKSDFEDMKFQIAQTSGIREAFTPVRDEVVGTVDGVTLTIERFYSIGGSVCVEFSLHNDSTQTIEFSPYDILLHKDGPIHDTYDTGEGGVIAPGETGGSYIMYQFMGFEPYLLEWNGLQIIITPVVS